MIEVTLQLDVWSLVVHLGTVSAFKFPPAAEYTCGGLSSTSSNCRTKRTLLNALASSGSFPAEQNATPPSFPPSFTCRGEHFSWALTVHSSNMIIYTQISKATHDSLQTASAHGSNCDLCAHWEFAKRQSITHKRVIADKCVDAKQRGREQCSSLCSFCLSFTSTSIYTRQRLLKKFGSPRRSLLCGPAFIINISQAFGFAPRCWWGARRPLPAVAFNWQWSRSGSWGGRGGVVMWHTHKNASTYFPLTNERLDWRSDGVDELPCCQKETSHCCPGNVTN